VSASVVGTGGDTPTSGLMQFTFGTEKVDVPVQDGSASHVFRATPKPGVHTVSVRYLGDEVFNASPVTRSSVTVEVRPTTLTYDGPASARWGEQIELGARLTDTLRSTPLAGRAVTFTIGSQTLTATTDEEGRATSSVPATSDVGSYDASATYVPAAGAFYGGSTASRSIAVDFRHYFATAGEKIGLNPATRQFNYKAAGSPNTGIIKAPGMFSVFLPSDVNYQGLPELPSVPAEQVRDGVTYVPGGTPVDLPELPALPDLPAFPAAGTPDAPSAEDTARNPVRVGGATLGEMVTRLASGDYPTDVTACEVLTRSECERRLTVLVHQQPGFVLVGVFDLRNGAFSAYKVDALGALPISAFDALSVELPDVPVLTPPTVPTPALPSPELPEVPAVPGAPASPALPAPPAPGTLAAFLVGQVNQVAAAGGMTPAQLAEQVLTVEVPTPAGGTEQVTTTLQGLIDRFAGTVVFDSTNTGISETPEVNAGSMMHTSTFTRTYGGKSVPKGSPRPFATKAEAEAQLPKYRVTRSEYVRRRRWCPASTPPSSCRPAPCRSRRRRASSRPARRTRCWPCTGAASSSTSRAAAGTSREPTRPAASRARPARARTPVATRCSARAWTPPPAPPTASATRGRSTCRCTPPTARSRTPRSTSSASGCRSWWRRASTWARSTSSPPPPTWAWCASR
jgi:hypothetical protein